MSITDDELRRSLGAGLSMAEIARRAGVSRQAIHERARRMELLTAAAASVAPGESRRFVARQLDAWEELGHSLHRINLLQDACDDWLRSSDDPSRYDLNPRSSEVDVTYEVAVQVGERLVIQKRKKRLADLLALIEGELDADGGRIVQAVKSEHKHADPRELILATAREVRQTVSTAAELARMLADTRAMAALREAIIDELRKLDASLAERVAGAVRRSILLNASFGGVELPETIGHRAEHGGNRATKP